MGGVILLCRRSGLAPQKGHPGLDERARKILTTVRWSSVAGSLRPVAFTRSIFKTIKSELIWPIAWQSRQQAENAVARYIDGFYNPVRRHSTLGFRSPIAHDQKARKVRLTLSTKAGQVQRVTGFRVGLLPKAKGYP
jgi:putative transposase